MMKRLLYNVFIGMFIFSLTGLANAQDKGKITGTVVDKGSNAPIQDASVSLYGQTDSAIVTGANTDEQGKFVIEGVPYGEYYLSANLIGYSTAVVKGIKLNTDKSVIDVGKITLKPGETTTEEIVVEEEGVSDVVITAEKKIFNIGKDLTLSSGSAIDALRNIPSVEVDQDGNVSLRGSENVKITVNGKSSGLDGPSRTNILESISADNIESIELITNPSAKYQAEGISGIVNIVLKESRGFGYNGTLKLNASTGDKYKSGLSFNLDKGDLNIFGDYSYRINTTNFNFDSDRQIFSTSSSPFSSFNANARYRSTSHYGRGGLDYSIDKLNSITISGSYYSGDENGGNAVQNREYDALRNVTGNYISNVKSEQIDKYVNGTFEYMKKFKNKGQELASEITYDFNSYDHKGFTTNEDIIPTNNQPLKYNEKTNGNNFEVNIKSDYVHPLGENSRFETGYHMEFRSDDDNYLNENFDYNTNQYVNDITKSNSFLFRRQVYGIYAQFGSEIDNFSYQLGLRGEQTSRNATLENNGQRNNQSYFDIFPSASLSQKLGAEEEIQFSYSRRINRPDSESLNPFPTFFVGSGNIFVGNADLQPEYNNNLEFSFVKYLSTTTITPSVYYRRANNEISKTRTLIDSNTAIVKEANYQSSDTYGAELIVSSRILPWWRVNGSITYYKTDINADNIDPGLSNNTSSFQGRIFSSIRIPDLFNVQLSYFHSGKILIAQGDIKPFKSFDFAISKDLFDNKATIGFNVRDVFNTMEFDIDLLTGSYSEALLFKKETRRATLTFSYKFGQHDKKQKRRRSREPGDNGGFGF